MIGRVLTIFLGCWFIDAGVALAGGLHFFKSVLAAQLIVAGAFILTLALVD